MHFDVRFVDAGFSDLKKNQLFYGHGAVHLLETGLVIEGRALAFHLPLMGVTPSLAHRLICNHTARTLPYSLIGVYRPPGRFWGSTHHIYTTKASVQSSARWADLTWVGFRVERYSDDFSSTLRDYLAAMQPAALPG
jgi:hypothetical protein